MRSRLVHSLVFMVFLMGVLGAAAAQTVDVDEIRGGLEARFVLSPLIDGVLLISREDGPGPRTVEVSGSAIAIDAQPVGQGRAPRAAGRGDRPVDRRACRARRRESPRAARPGRSGAGSRRGGGPGDRGGPRPRTEEANAAVIAESVGDEGEESARSERDETRREPRTEKRRPRRTGEPEVAFAGNLTVEKDEVTEDVLVFGGRLKVIGRVEGDATVIGGSANIEGEVEGDVTAIGGPVRLEEGSLVQGDVTSVGGKVYREDGARVEGDVEQVPFNADLNFGPLKDWHQWRDRESAYRHFDVNPWGWWSGIGWELFGLLVVAALAWLSLLLAQKPIGRMERRIESEPWKTGLVGLLAIVLFVPTFVMLAVFLAISIIGIPLLLVLPFLLLAVAIAGWLGLVAVAGRVGSWAEERFGWRLGSPFWIVLVGFALLSALSIVGELLDFGVAPMRFIAAMFAFFGAIVSFAAWTIACGAAVLTRFGTADSWNRAEEFAAPLPPVPDLGGAGGSSDAAGATGEVRDGLDWSDESVFDEAPIEPDDSPVEADEPPIDPDESDPSDELGETGADK